jgi:hypothetical protein
VALKALAGGRAMEAVKPLTHLISLCALCNRQIHTHTFIHLLRSGLGTICKHNFVGKISVHARCAVIESVNLRR